MKSMLTIKLTILFQKKIDIKRRWKIISIPL
jgi:hypothetical protein